MTEDKVFKEYPTLRFYYDEIVVLPKLKEHFESE